MLVDLWDKVLRMRWMFRTVPSELEKDEEVSTGLLEGGLVEVRWMF